VPAVNSVQSKAVKASLPTESIADEVVDEVGSVEDDIPEESGLSASRKKENEDIIRDEYESDNIRAAEAKQKIEARNRLRFGLSSDKTDNRTKDQVMKEQVILGIGE
jgi:hypothetical protein